MKIPLNSGNNGISTESARTQALQKDLLAAKKGDWKARYRIEAAMLPILKEMAHKRASNNHDINALLEAGKAGIATAIKKYKPATGADRFQMFAVRFVEDKMNNLQSGGSFWSRIFSH